MNIPSFKTKAKLIRGTEVYNVFDLPLSHLNLSLTELHIGQKTSGHYHDEADEVYLFISGNGKIQVGDEFTECQGGDVFTISRGAFHKVWNEGTEDLKFWCVFEKYADR